MPTVTADILAAIAYTALVFFGGWQVESWHTQSQHAKELQAEITADNAQEKHVGGIAMAFEAASLQSRTSQAALMVKWSDLNAKPHTACDLSPGAISVLKSATASDHLPR